MRLFANAFATFYWRDGVIKVDVSAAGSLQFYSRRLEFTGAKRTERQLAFMVGKSLSEIDGIPFRGGSKVELADKLRNGFRLTLASELMLVNLETKQIWHQDAKAA